QLQNGADAAALAGASVYCEKGAAATEAEARSRAHTVGESNNTLGMGSAESIKIDDGDITVEQDPNTSAYKVGVTTRSTTSQFFEKLLQAAVLKSNQAGATSDNVAAYAQAACGATCGVKCIKPWSPPDRWDDVTPIKGYDGKGGKNAINWANDGH